MDGSRFDWELRHGQGVEGFDDSVEARIARAAAPSGPLSAEMPDRPGAPTAAWAPILIWMSLGATVAITLAL